MTERTRRKSMKRIGFHDREKEIKEFTDILDSEPSLITFVYGPINSGKTALVNHLISRQLPEECAPFYINLRGRFITGYEDFLNVLFEIDEGGVIDNISEYAASILKDLKIVSGIPIPLNLFEQIFEKKDKSKDMFRYIERFFMGISEKRVPVLIIDELQVIGDMKIDGLLVYKLFNFFVRLTKELHLAHIFVITSDSLFLEQVYSEAMLEGRCRYLLVDDFDYETTATFLGGHGFTGDENALAWEYCGGKPVCLVELVNAKQSSGSIVEMSERMLNEEVSRLIFMMARNRERKNDIVEMLSIFDSVEETKYSDSMDLDLLSFLVKQNILFLDPVERTIKPQSQLSLLAIRGVLKDV